MQVRPDLAAQGVGSLGGNGTTRKSGTVEPGVRVSVRIIAVAGKQMPVDVRLRVTVASMVHLPGMKGLNDRICSDNHFLKECRLNRVRELMQFPHMLLQEQ